MVKKKQDVENKKHSLDKVLLKLRLSFFYYF